MTYYDELGLPRNASVREIRQAYRVLARLLHPDGHIEEPVRAMAERQMKRLNEILYTLTDHALRRAYDDTLLPLPSRLPVRSSSPAAPRSRSVLKPFQPALKPWRTRLPQWAQITLLNWFWVVLGAAIAMVAFWYVAAGQAAPVTAGSLSPADPPQTRPVARPSAPSSSRPAMPPPSPVPPVPAQANRPAEASGSAQLPPAPDPPRNSLPAAATALPGPLAQAAPDPPAPASPLAGSRFAGNWFYVPELSGHPVSGRYAATYVELMLTEQHGELSGAYRARYHVPDQAVSPEVSFRLEGPSPDGDTARLAWTAVDGAGGQVQVVLAGPNLATVTWWTTAFGRRAFLASGSAKLVRQVVP